MSKRGSLNFGLVSLVIAVVGASALAACTDGDGVSDGSAGKAGSVGKAGSAGESGEAGESAGGAHAGSGGAHAGSGGAHAGSGGLGKAGMNTAGDEPGGAGGMGGEAGAITPWSVDPELKKLSPLPALPADPTNKYAEDPAAAALGQRLFFDKRYSGKLTVAGELGNVDDTGKVACATCHLGGAMSDGREPYKVTKGTGIHTRNAPALVNSSFYDWTNWGGRFAAQWELPLAVAENALTMNSTRLTLAHFIYDNYRAPYEAVFGALPSALDASASDAARFPASGRSTDASWQGMTADDRDAVNLIIVNYGKAIQAYLRKLVSRNAPFDQYVESGAGDLSESAIRGSLLFVGKAKCTLCHSGPFMTDNKFHNLGVVGTDDGRFKDAASLVASTLNIDGKFSDKRDTGRLLALATPDETTHAAFRTSSLREVKDTAPYMHNGELADLAAVVSFYNIGGGVALSGSTKDPLLTPLGLSDTEQADLVEFLKTLSGEPLPQSLLAPLP